MMTILTNICAAIACFCWGWTGCLIYTTLHERYLERQAKKEELAKTVQKFLDKMDK